MLGLGLMSETKQTSTRGEVEDAARDVPVHTAWARVMTEVRSVEKGDYNDFAGFSFRGIDAVMNAVGPALRRHGVSIVPESVKELRYDQIETGQKRSLVGHALLIQIYRVWGPRGDSLTIETVGEASDAGDKAVPKASSVAFRTALLQALCLPTGDPDPDSYSYDRSDVSRETSGRGVETSGQDPAGLEYANRVFAAKTEIWERLDALGVPQQDRAQWIEDELRRLTGNGIRQATASDLETLLADIRGRQEVDPAPDSNETAPEERG